MSEKSNVWVTTDGDDWIVRREGSDRAYSRRDTQREALEAGPNTARREQVELIWQGRDRMIWGRNSYGNAPHPPPG